MEEEAGGIDGSKVALARGGIFFVTKPNCKHVCNDGALINILI